MSYFVMVSEEGGVGMAELSAARTSRGLAAQLRVPLVDHGLSAVHDMCHQPLGHNHQISVPAHASSADLAKLRADGYGYRSGWVDHAGKHGPAGQRWLLYTRRENTDGTVTRPIAF